ASTSPIRAVRRWASARGAGQGWGQTEVVSMKQADIDRAREFRQELERIEAAMHRIKALWLSEDFPCADQLDGLSSSVAGIEADMKSIVELSDPKDFPCADDFDDLSRAVGGIRSDMQDIIEKADELPSADALQS